MKTSSHVHTNVAVKIAFYALMHKKKAQLNIMIRVIFKKKCARIQSNSEQIRFTIQLPTDIDAKYSTPGKAAGWGLRPRPCCSYQVSGAQNIHNLDAGND
jgi:hypothetical protein